MNTKTKPKKETLSEFHSNIAPAHEEMHGHDEQPVKISKNEQSGYKSLTIRITDSDWERLRELAISERDSVQRIGVKALSDYFRKRGLPPLETNRVRSPRW